MQSFFLSPFPRTEEVFCKATKCLRGKVRENKHFYSNQLMQALPNAMVLVAIVRLESFKSIKTLCALYHEIYKIAVVFFCQGKTRNLFFRNPRREPPAFCRGSFQICPSSFPCSVLRLCWCRCHISHKLQKQVA